MVEPAVLIWARESIDLSVDEAAKKLRVKPERLRQWESGQRPPSVAQLRNAARVYKRPTAVFFLAEAPTDFDVLRDFRRVPEAELGRWSPALHSAIRRAHEQQDITLDLSHLLGEEVPERPRVTVSPADADAFAAAMRDILGITLEEQFEWSDRYTALNAWIDAVESTGILILQASRIDVEEMRGFSIGDHAVPAIVLNGADAARGRIFTVLHELAHVLMEAPGVCDLHDVSGPRPPDDDVELRCNAIAASVLMPQAALEGDELLRQAPSDGVWPEDRIRAIAGKYSVSQEATLRRLLSIGLTTWDHYKRMRQKYRRRYATAVAKQREKGTGGPPPHRMRVRDLGRPFVRMVLDAYYQDQINTSEVADYLGVKVNSLPKIETEAFRTAA